MKLKFCFHLLLQRLFGQEMPLIADTKNDAKLNLIEKSINNVKKADDDLCN